MQQFEKKWLKVQEIYCILSYCHTLSPILKKDREQTRDFDIMLNSTNVNGFGLFCCEFQISQV